MIVPASRCLEPSDSTCYTVGPRTRNASHSTVTNACVQVLLLIAIECWTTCSMPRSPATMQSEMRGTKPFAPGQQTKAFFNMVAPLGSETYFHMPALRRCPERQIEKKTWRFRREHCNASENENKYRIAFTFFCHRCAKLLHGRSNNDSMARLL